MTDRQLMQQALDALKKYHYYTLDMGHPNHSMLHEGFNAVTALRERLAHCDRCGKKMGGEGDIHTCTPDPIGAAQEKLIAELAAQPAPVQKPVATMRMLHTYGDTTPPAAAQPEPMRLYVEDFASRCGWKKDSGEGAFEYVQRKSYAQGLEDATPPAAAHMTEFEEAVAAVDNTLHHAIDHWQNRALKAEALLAQPEQEPVAIDWDTKTDTPIMGYTTPPAAARRKPLPYSEWPKKPSPYVNDEYRGYSRSDLHDYAMQVLAAHGIK